MSAIKSSLPPPQTTTPSSSNNILSTKVQRALQVRTDTPAMTNALSSLASLQHQNNIDARNVRNAIEEDALHQAKLLENELQNLCSMVGKMRMSIKDVLNVAECVGKSLETGVLNDYSSSKNLTATTTTTAAADDDDDDDDDVDEESKVYNNNIINHEIEGNNHAFEEERKLAALIADAFHEREEAKLRYNAISEFLEKYNLEERDSMLLEHYNFEDVFENHYTSSSSSSSSSSVVVDHKKTVRFSSSATKMSSQQDHEENEIKDGMAFLNALHRVTLIRKELASSLDHDLSSGNGNGNGDNHKKSISTASHLGAASALRMVETLASKQERAFERLYHFLHNNLDLNQSSKMTHVPTSSNAATAASSRLQHSLTSEDEDAMDEMLGHPFIKKSLVVLKYVPAYYAHTLEMIATSRRSAVTRKFLLALTHGYNGMAPIEMKAHDPVNYVGDMLAFVFRTVSVESELAKAFTDDNDTSTISNDGSCKGNDDQGEEDVEYKNFMSASDVLNDALGGVARPLKSRISQVIASLARRPDEDEEHHGLNEHGFMDEEADTARLRLTFLYSICGLIVFYRSAMTKAVQKLSMKQDSSKSSSGMVIDEERSPYLSNPLVQCLSECLEDAARAYVASLKVYCAMLDHLASMTNESQAQLSQSVILRLCNVRSTSPGFGPDFEDDMVGISNDALEALSLEYLCNTIFDAVMVSCSNIDDVVTMKAALHASKKNGLSSDVSAKWNELLLKEEEKMIDEQIARDTNYVLDECGLGSIASALESMKAVFIEGMIVSSHPGLSQQSLEEAITKFYSSLVDLPLPSYDNIKDPVLKKRSRNKIADNIASVYEEIYNVVTDEKGGYSDLTFMVNTPTQVKVLLHS